MGKDTDPKQQEAEIRIASFDELTQHAGQVVKYSEDGGESWRYALLGKGPQEFDYPWGLGISCHEELLPDGAHSSGKILLKHFSDEEFIVKKPTQEEIEGKKFSHQD